MPAEVVDPGSGVTASLNSVTITSIAGTPLGLAVELNDVDGVYYPADGQTSGCATICGEPVLPGVYEMVISISAIASAFGIEQVVNESFPYTIIIDPGAGGTTTFSFTPSVGCNSLWADFNASLIGAPGQITAYAWDFGNGMTSDAASEFGVFYSEPGTYSVTLQTTISDLVLQQLILNSTGGGGWDDFFTAPDPYFVLTDGSGTNVYTSSTADDSNSNTWSGLSVILSNPPYTISFYDEDLLDGDDGLGSTSFTPTDAGAIPLMASPSYAVANIGLVTSVDVIDSADVFVYAAPVVGIYQSSDSVLSCTNPDLSLYQWSLGDSLVYTDMNFEFLPSQSGWYTVEGVSAFGCSAVSDSLLFCLPNTTISLELHADGDTPETLETDGNVFDYVWSVNGVVQDTLNGPDGAFWFPVQSGWYSVAAIDVLGCPLVSDSLLVCWPLDSLSVFQDAAGQLVTNEGFIYYQWWLQGAPIDGENDSILTDAGPGNYAVSATDFMDCPSTMSADWVYVSLVESDPTFVDWNAHPNPFQNGVELSLPWTSSAWEISLYDSRGVCVHSDNTNGLHFRLDLSHLSAGTYILKGLEIGGAWRALPARKLIKR